jgi:hypothetical protein
MKLTLKLTGTKPMLQHNGRLANPLDPHTRAIASISKKRGKTDDDLQHLALLEARGGFWETADNLVGIPRSATWRAIEEAARAFKLGKDIKRSLHFEDVTDPMLINGKTITCDDYLKLPNSFDYRPVVIAQRKTMRARPIIQAGWEITQEFELLTDVMRVENLAPVFERAGRLVGLGDWRPTYGTFSIEVI